jgi:hypothetical protein
MYVCGTGASGGAKGGGKPMASLFNELAFPLLSLERRVALCVLHTGGL